jgi:hypothetical protein
MKTTKIRREKLLTYILVFIIVNGIYKNVNRIAGRVKDAKSTNTYTDPIHISLLWFEL